jgi:four helix bundle protein
MGRFKELRVWRDSMDLAERVYSLCRKEPFSKDFGLMGQITRAAISIPSNIAEGDERGSKKEAIYFFNIAKGSTAEVITQLELAYRIGYIDQQELAIMDDLAQKVRASLKNLIRAKGGFKDN